MHSKEDIEKFQLNIPERFEAIAYPYHVDMSKRGKIDPRFAKSGWIGVREQWRQLYYDRKRENLQ